MSDIHVRHTRGEPETVLVAETPSSSSADSCTTGVPSSLAVPFTV